MKRFATLTMMLICLAAIFSCSGGGGSHDDASLTAIAPTVEADCATLGSTTCPGAVDCRSYRNPAGRAITVDPFWQERLDLCCGLRLCSVDGECRYGCPPDLLDDRCPGAR